MYILSAIVSTYNSEEFIRGCIEDLEKQTIAHEIEIIVINSNSRQNEDAIVKKLRGKYGNIVYVKTDHRESIYRAWNRGLKPAAGKYITNANTDDRHKPDGLERMVNFLEENKDIDLVYAWQWLSNVPNQTFADFIALDKERWPDGLLPEMEKYLAQPVIGKITKGNRSGYVFKWPPFSQHLLYRYDIIGPQPVWKKSIHDSLGYFDERYQIGGDYEFWLRMMTAGYTFCLIPEILGVFYLGGDNKSVAEKEQFWLEKLWQTEKYSINSSEYRKRQAHIFYGLLTAAPEPAKYFKDIDALIGYDIPAGERYHIASRFKQLGEHHRSLKWFESINRTEADPALLGGRHFHMGEIYLNKGNRDSALNHFKKTLNYIPDHRKAREYLKRPVDK